MPMLPSIASPIIYGFTGSRESMEKPQIARLAQLLQEARRRSYNEKIQIHHGDCVGADTLAHRIALVNGLEIHVHPPINPRFRAFTRGYHAIYSEREYKVRNENIVAACKLLIAAPRGFEADHPRSGTWQTIRMAERAGKKVVIIWPSGNTDML